jgi:hypothetical protein
MLSQLNDYDMLRYMILLVFWILLKKGINCRKIVNGKEVLFTWFRRKQ